MKTISLIALLLSTGVTKPAIDGPTIGRTLGETQQHYYVEGGVSAIGLMGLWIFDQEPCGKPYHIYAAIVPDSSGVAHPGTQGVRVWCMGMAPDRPRHAYTVINWVAPGCVEVLTLYLVEVEP